METLTPLPHLLPSSLQGTRNHQGCFPSLASYTPGDIWLSEYVWRVPRGTGGV